LQDPPKFTQIWIFGLKTNHLATLGRLPENNNNKTAAKKSKPEIPTLFAQPFLNSSPTKKGSSIFFRKKRFA
jgi:hypothetical protein